MVWAGICLLVVPKNYETAYFLNEKDKEIMRHRAQLTASYSGGNGHYTLKDIKMAAKDVKSWVHGVIQICVVTILYGEFPLHTFYEHDDNNRRVWNVPAYYSKGWISLLHYPGPISCNPRLVFNRMPTRGDTNVGI